MLNLIKGASVAAAFLMAAPAFAQVYGPDYGYSYSYGPGPGPAYDPGYDYGPGYAPAPPAPGDYVETPAPAGPPMYEGRSVAAQPDVGMQQDTTAWCESHYRSYNPQTGTYLGYDGLRHPCP